MKGSTRSVKYNLGRQRRSRGAGKGGGGGKRMVKWLLLLLVVALAVGYLPEVVSRLQYIAQLPANVQLEDVALDKGNKVASNEVMKTLVVIENPSGSEGEIESVYYLIENREKGLNGGIHIPGWVYVDPRVDVGGAASELVSVRNLLYAYRDGGLGGYSLSLDEISEAIALPVDQYIWIKSDLAQVLIKPEELAGISAKDKLERVMKGLSVRRLFLFSERGELVKKGIYSNFGIVEIFNKSALFAQASSKEQFTLVDGGADNVTDSVTLSTGKTVEQLNVRQFDGELESLYETIRPKSIEREQAKAEVYNGSEITGLAGAYARKVQNLGVAVVRYDNARGEYPQTTIYVADQTKYENTLEAVKELVPVQPQVVDGRPEFLATGDIVLVLGQDLAK